MELAITLAAPVTLVVAPYKDVPNLPPGYVEARRENRDGATVIECWPASVKPDLRPVAGV